MNSSMPTNLITKMNWINCSKTLTKDTQGEIDNLNRPISIEVTESLIIFQKRKHQALMVSLVNSIKQLRKK